ncbi:UNVERIFIED_CONTAM: hypothetical protein GTU68_045046 [Idotea baltica]|nr:hypothetical protein [Idotea baltica]
MNFQLRVVDRPIDNTVRSVSVIVPTYQEAVNLVHLLPRIAHAIESAGIVGEIIVVDDNSRDGTVAVCEVAGQNVDCSIRLIVRTKDRGLATAVLAGMDQANGDVLVVMDADFSHPPESIPDLVNALTGRVDFVFGSRYVKGGAVSDDWGALRWLNSKVATLLARGLTSAHDPMAGFFAISKDTYRSAESVNPLGYKIGLELIVRCKCQQVAEVPIQFVDRQHGESKLDLKQQVLYVQHLLRLYRFQFPGIAGYVRFGLVGVSGIAVDLAVFQSMLFVMSPAMARCVGIVVAMVWNYLLNREFTFQVVASRRPTFCEFCRFAGACFAGAIINWSLSLGLIESVSWFANRPIAAAVPGILIGSFANYFLCSRFVFGTSSDTRNACVPDEFQASDAVVVSEPARRNAA